MSVKGELMAQHGLGRLGINPDAYGVWKADALANTTWDAFLDTSAAAGFVAVELGPAGYLPRKPEELQRELAARDLELTCGYLPVAFDHLASRDAMFDQLGRVAGATEGAEFVLALALAGWSAGTRIPNDDAHWQAIVEGLAALSSSAADDHGLRLVFHPHVGMAVETQAEVERLIDDTNGQVALCFDLGQFAYAGGDPAAFIRGHGDQIAYIHLRDIDLAIRDACVADGIMFEAAARRDVFCEPGTGDIDFPAVVDAARSVAFDGPIVVERSYLGRTPAQAQAAALRAFETYTSFGFGTAAQLATST